MTSNRIVKQFCEWDKCDMPAEGWVEAQWSVVDFVRYEGCVQHLGDMYDILWDRRIDDQQPVDVHSHLYVLVE